MKSVLRISTLVLVALFLTSSAFAEVSNKKKKKLGIATYSVKGLESDIEGALKCFISKMIM